MSGWHSPDVAFDPNHAPMADPPMIRFTAPEIGPAPYHVKRKNRHGSGKSGNARAAASGTAAKRYPKPGKINGRRSLPAYREASVAARVAGTIEQRKSYHSECRGSPRDRRQHLQDRHGEGLPGSALSKNPGTHVHPKPGLGRASICPGSRAGAAEERR